MDDQTLLPADDELGQMKQIMTTMKAVVNEFGRDHVYQRRPSREGVGSTTCFYVTSDGTGPDCLVGHVLYRLGVPLTVLSRREGGGPGTIADLSMGAEDILGAAQGEQDMGSTWGEAYDRAYVRANDHYPDEFPLIATAWGPPE